MALTKPAGCAIQFIGAPLLIVGFFMIFSKPIFGIALLSFGVLLLFIGRQPAVDKSKD